jgi:hypothetical protein
MLTYRLNKNTDLLRLERGAYGTAQASGISGYLRLPLTVAEGPLKTAMWRVLLELTGEVHGMLPFEIASDVVLGRGCDESDAPDLDLTVLDALDLGVSRRHAMLRPTAQHLFLIDLGSTNGTFVNGLHILGKAHPLAKGDHLSLGKLNMSILHLALVPGTEEGLHTADLQPPDEPSGESGDTPPTQPLGS